jgi:hypothetical protein
MGEGKLTDPQGTAKTMINRGDFEYRRECGTDDCSQSRPFEKWEQSYGVVALVTSWQEKVAELVGVVPAEGIEPTA